MAPPKWTTPPQEAWLETMLPKYMQRQGEGKLHLFWPTMNEGWFRAFPAHVKLKLPLPTDPDGRALTVVETALLGAEIKTTKSVSDTLIFFILRRRD